MIALQIDDKKIEVAEGTNLLETCLDNGIYIPNLCHLKGMQLPPPPAACVWLKSRAATIPFAPVRSRSFERCVYTQIPRGSGNCRKPPCNCCFQPMMWTVKIARPIANALCRIWPNF